jgi:hypothetical protein
MIGRKDMKQETMAKRTRNRAMTERMVSPRKKMDMGMSPGPDMGAASAPPMMSPTGMKKGGMAKKPLSYTMKKGGMAKKPAKKKGGMMLIIGIGKKKGK